MSQPQDKTFRCRLISPERVVLDCEARFVVLPAHDGQIGIAANRAPLVCKLGIGAVRVDSPDGSQHYFVDGGFARVRGNELSILTPKAVPDDQIDRAAAEKLLQQAGDMPLGDPTRADVLARARTQLTLTDG